MTAFWLALPMLAVGFAAGIVISLFQILTSIQDTAFNAIPATADFSGDQSSWPCRGCCRGRPPTPSTFSGTSAGMGGELVLSTATLLGFLLTLVRVSGVFIFIPIPGMSSVVQPTRIVLVLGITVALFTQWPQITATPTVGLFTMWLVLEAALGIGIGLAVAFVAESFAVGAQVMGLQAGYAFASTIDPIPRPIPACWWFLPSRRRVIVLRHGPGPGCVANPGSQPGNLSRRLVCTHARRRHANC